MTYFPDLGLCYYHSGVCDADSWSVPLLAIGWIEHPQTFPRGVTPKDLRTILDEMSHRARYIYSGNNFRGLHQCSVCIDECRSSSGLEGSHVNIFVPGIDLVYLASGGIRHYIESHEYLPPLKFIQAVLTCPEYGSLEFQEALQISNAGNAPPLQVNEKFRSNPAGPVADLAAAVEWYRRVFGFEWVPLNRSDTMRNHALLHRDGGSIWLTRKDESARGRTDPVQAHIWLKEGLDELFQRVRAMSVEIIQPPENHPRGYRDFKVADLDSNIVWVTTQPLSSEPTTN